MRVKAAPRSPPSAASRRSRPGRRRGRGALATAGRWRGTCEIARAVCSGFELLRLRGVTDLGGVAPLAEGAAPRPGTITGAGGHGESRNISTPGASNRGKGPREPGTRGAKTNAPGLLL